MCVISVPVTFCSPTDLNGPIIIPCPDVNAFANDTLSVKSYSRRGLESGRGHERD